ncbi:GntR family transcriptional regulator [Pseudonocardia sp. KRD-184]|uniref:GntR family transcriptional regulator n=1 Tax=Pseudonocardia oceani TaxID=2792013 RepID=A0ABS6UEK4_9PSEU|nr:GntR family transcriptional regulator [Pseudonocardia oceani]MBW0098287.1 GntR family transcriptional regulator [Pseudonocardia oceani]MBW0110830.1 GntR family transcriptional regulator [Pseudonocardia oceani]MBW0121691.1 GntR family transcriptional regulator [Pseudonocardia oceani]MBW0130653.1 GntR family transcriptional regulator [Pseudonocardia oceani]
MARLIRELIMTGEATEHLAARFGVSATPVREALMSLHGEAGTRHTPVDGSWDRCHSQS